ncbi:LytR family transcriptional regulator [Clostridia bacterium]|nr:LytR family transcriptional regulator [Clostridia bacterium]
MGKKRRKLLKRDKLIIALVILLGIGCFLYVGYQILLQTNIFGGEKFDNNLLVVTTTVTQENSDFDYKPSVTTVVVDDSESGIIAEKVVNILCVGFDESNVLTDVIMLVSLNTEKKTVNVLQIPRDTYVGTWETGKINAAYGQTGKMQSLIDEINDDFQLPVTHYMSISLNKFASAIDAIGGIEVDVPRRIPGEGWYPEIKAGKQILDGHTAEWLVRHRKSYTDADLGRQKMQQVFLAACMQKAKNIGITEVIKVIPNVLGYFKTDMVTEELLKLAKTFMSIDMDNVRVFTLPGEAVWEKNEAFSNTNYYNYSVYSIHKNDTAKLLNMYFRASSAPVPANYLNIFEIVTSENYQVHYSFSEDGISFADIEKDTSVVIK